MQNDNPQEASPPQLPALAPADVSERQWALFAHLSPVVGLVFPFGHLLAPFLIWQFKKHQLPFAADQAKEALNFQITMTLALLVSLMLSAALIGFLLIPVLAVWVLVLMVMAAIKANDGNVFRYPWTLRLVK